MPSFLSGRYPAVKVRKKLYVTVEDKKTRAFVVRRKADFDNEDWQDLYAWLVDWMWKLRAVMQEFGE